MLAKLSVKLDRKEEINKKIDKTKNRHDRILLKKIGTTQKGYLNIKKKAEIYNKTISNAQSNSKSLRKLFAINNTTISMQLDFRITENNNATTNGTITWPIHLGSVSLVYKAGKEKTRVAQRVVHLTSTLQELSNQTSLGCTGNNVATSNNRTRIYPIVGNVGIGEFIHQYFKIINDVRIPTKSDTFTDTLTFTTKLLGQVNPTIQIKPVSPSLIEAGLDLNTDRTDVHEVSIQMKPYSPPSTPKDPKLHITKIPNITLKITEGIDGHGKIVSVN